MLGVLNKSPGTLPGILPGRYKIQVALTVKHRTPDNLTLPGNVPGAKMDPGILPGPTAMHPGTTTFFFPKVSTTQHTTSSTLLLVRVLHFIHPCRTAAPLTGCHPTFTTESASGFGTSTGQDWALRGFFKLNLPTTN